MGCDWFGDEKRYEVTEDEPIKGVDSLWAEAEEAERLKQEKAAAKMLDSVSLDQLPDEPEIPGTVQAIVRFSVSRELLAEAAEHPVNEMLADVIRERALALLNSWEPK